MLRADLVTLYILLVDPSNGHQLPSTRHGAVRVLGKPTEATRRIREHVLNKGHQHPPFAEIEGLAAGQMPHLTSPLNLVVAQGFGP